MICSFLLFVYTIQELHCDSKCSKHSYVFIYILNTDVIQKTRTTHWAVQTNNLRWLRLQWAVDSSWRRWGWSFGPLFCFALVKCAWETAQEFSVTREKWWVRGKGGRTRLRGAGGGQARTDLCYSFKREVAWRIRRNKGCEPNSNFSQSWLKFDWD